MTCLTHVDWTTAPITKDILMRYNPPRNLQSSFKLTNQGHILSRSASANGQRKYEKLRLVCAKLNGDSLRLAHDLDDTFKPTNFINKEPGPKAGNTFNPAPVTIKGSKSSVGSAFGLGSML